ncbi:PLP-dependent transferase [Macrolepiota fuliginosa MF-IS2]|uniref:PLP-dependent transferase n=1 Tax=Macrolepiota fuliginosa MF-IS2 TaxID=1400762 RepID=A0A9P6C3A8_9AGAR|nr:PLP-dependent transferase [Macrolepiota fuliginosa MF-IS2]
MSSALETKLAAALASRDDRWIRRRLPDPATASSLALTDFTSNDYLSLASSSHLRTHFLNKLHLAPDILGSGGSRLLVNGQAHADLEDRLRLFFGAEAALLFNSGFDANVGFFSCIPQAGDVIVHDEYIHASVHDGIRASRVDKASLISFEHNSVLGMRVALRRASDRIGRSARQSVFVAVESLYSMDGTFAPLKEMVEVIEEVFPEGNAYLVVDEAHTTGIYGPEGRGRVAMLGLENKVLARLHTFGKALAATGAVVLTNNLIKDYMLNYARSLIYTTSLSYANIIAADASFDMLTDGTASHLSKHLLSLSTYLTSALPAALKAHNIPSSLVSLLYSLHPPLHSGSDDPSQIIPILTPHPRPLSAYLLAQGMNARPITWPTVPKGKDRVRVCLHAGNTREDVDRLVNGVVMWAGEVLLASEEKEVRAVSGDEWERSKL